MPGEIKGGQVPLVYDTFIVTSQYHPDEIFEKGPALDAILRRFKLVHYEMGDGDDIIELPPTQKEKIPEFMGDPEEPQVPARIIVGDVVLKRPRLKL